MIAVYGPFLRQFEIGHLKGQFRGGRPVKPTAPTGLMERAMGIAEAWESFPDCVEPTSPRPSGRQREAQGVRTTVAIRALGTTHACKCLFLLPPPLSFADWGHREATSLPANAGWLRISGIGRVIISGTRKMECAAMGCGPMLRREACWGNELFN